MVNSMTGFAALKGAHGAARWHWEVRTVNARGLDVKFRTPEGCEGVEGVVRTTFSKALTRGNVNLTLRLHKDTSTARATLDEDQLELVVAAMKAAEEAADAQGLALAPSTATGILALRGVLEGAAADDTDMAAIVEKLKAELPLLVADLVAARAAEGKATQKILQGQLGEIEALIVKAATAADARKDKMAASLHTNLNKLLENTEGADEARVAQELAILIVKSDVSEELDRLNAHVQAAHELLGTAGAIGRKFDFLMQEFNREANTLCSKSGYADLTAIGLDLKTYIDQMREQVQNVE